MTAGRHGKRVAVPVKDLDDPRVLAQPFARQRRIVDGHGRPAHLQIRRAYDVGTERAGQQLPAEAMSDDGDPSRVGIAQECELVGDPRQRIIDAHVAAERADAGILRRR